ncbi:uncharacterized protein PHACADRAFT_261616 [Phanerochaete carnosa HHB-10118-sp]|uniref:DUF4203 domain-containing protein n=1 Tax=Phanerochaete carnosa (strain HHB-10118-sp) TaxID=650164 RepID=K5VY00_PHACS|nr:uncharacterized protein PHACADRAFT_261616 [Phanerochaete carnosa HHB-10118-sp]EKM51474.1 hypothetical protein PHACADRAFT_261616 [Phanerochaete carnosa HHB-10118-sp]
MLSAICCTIFSGRWKYVTLTFAAASGYATLAIALIVISHPSLITRIAITIAFTVIGTVLSLLPFASTRDIALRFANASTGSFGLVLSIAILVRNTAWGNVWERLWVSDGDGWGTSQEKGLSAAYSLLFCAGAACDWLLHVKLGENPDEKWDHYLAKYSGSMPTDGSRAGNFTPFASLYDRLLGRDRYFAPIAPDQKLPVLPLRSGPSEKLRDLQEPFDIPIPLTSTKPQPGFLRKKNIPRDGSMHTAKRAIRFQSGDDESSSSEEEDELLTNKPFVLRPLSPASSATLTNSYTDVKPPSLTFAEVPEYSDYEEDLTEASRERASRDVPHWTPGFFRRHSMRYGVRPADTPSQQIGSRGSASSPHLASQQERPLQAAESTPGAVVLSSIPATPSLIRAVDRIATAYTTQAAPPEGRDNTFARDARPIPRKPWDTFWADVKAKAQT